MWYILPTDLSKMLICNRWTKKGFFQISVIEESIIQGVP